MNITTMGLMMKNIKIFQHGKKALKHVMKIINVNTILMYVIRKVFT